MATKTFWLTDSYAGGTHDWGSANETQPSLYTSGTGWTVGKLAAGNYSLFARGVERATTSFGTTALPNAGLNQAVEIFGGDGWRTHTALTGNFAAGNWSIVTRWIAVSNGGAMDGNIRIRVWRGTNAAGTGATEVTSSVLVGSTVTNLATSAAQESSITWNAPAMSLANEYLWFQAAWQITGAGGNNSADCLLRVGDEGNGCRVLTTDFATGLAASGALGTVNVSAPAATVTLNDAILKQRTCVGAGL